MDPADGVMNVAALPDRNRKSQIHTMQKNLTPSRVLILAKGAMDDENINAFKKARSVSLDYLEPQYQHLCSASMDIVQFIRHKKQERRLICGRNTMSFESGQEDEIAEAIVLLEDYASAFKRDSPGHIKVEIKKEQQIFDHHYSTMEHAENLYKMNRDFSVGDCRQLHRYFISAFERLNEKFLEIQKARQLIFEHDRCNERGCDIATTVHQSDDLRDRWDVNEPESSDESED